MLINDVVTTLRASDREPVFEDAAGPRNSYREVSSCDRLDRSVP